MNDIKTENELKKQEEITDMLKDILYIRYGNRQPLAFVHTYGCQQNVADSEKLKGMLIKMGCEMTEDKEQAEK